MHGALFNDGWQRFLERLRRLWGELRNRGPFGGVATRGTWSFRGSLSESLAGIIRPLRARDETRAGHPQEQTAPQRRQLERWDDDGGARRQR